MTENEPHAFIVAPPPSRPKTGPPVLRAARVDEAAAVNQDEVSPDKAKLHYQSYHDYYYSITPRDPRLEVPLKPIWPDPTPTSPLTPCTTAARPQEPEIAELTRDGGPSRLTHTPPPPPAADTVTAKPVEKPAVESPIPAQPRIAAAPRASPAERPLSRQGNTHQPYATTPVTPDFLPMGLLDRSPALASLSLPTNETQYDAYADAHRQAAQHSIFGAPSMYYPQSVQPAAMMMMMPQDAAAGYQRPLQAQPIASLPLGTAQAPPGGFNVYRGRGAARGGRGGSGTSHNTPPSPAQSAAKSAMLQQFHENPRATLSLPDLTGHIVEFSVDQDGSRLIQRLMVDDATADAVYREVVASVVNLIVDVFGNYVIQRLFECGNEKHHGGLIQAMRGSILPLSLQTYGCRVVQKALQFASHEDQRAIAAELIGHVADCVRDQNGNHVIQKCIEVMPNEAQFIAEAFRGQLPGLASHAYGCRVMQRLFERCPNTDPALEAVVNETLTFTSQLVNDQYGNYVIQHIIINGTHQWRQNVLMLLLSSFSKLSCSKFSSNVTEKLFLHSDEAQRRIIIEAILNERDAQGRCSLVFMMQDQFANYVVQRLLDLSPQPLRERMVEAIMPFLPEIKRFTYGKHIVARLEKMGLLPRSQQGGGFHYHQPQGHQGQAAQNLSPGMAFQQAPAFPQAAPVFAQAFQQQAVYSPSAAYQLLPAGGQFASAPSVSVNFAGMQPQRIVQPVAPIAEPFQHVPSPQYQTERPSPIDGPLEMSHRRQPNQLASNATSSAQNQRFTQSSTAFSSQNAKHVNPSSLHQLDPAVASAFPAQSPQAVWSG